MLQEIVQQLQSKKEKSKTRSKTNICICICIYIHTNKRKIQTLESKYRTPPFRVNSCQEYTHLVMSTNHTRKECSETTPELDKFLMYWSRIGHGTIVLERLHHSAESDPTLEEEEHHGLTKHLDPTEVHGDRIPCSIKEFTSNYSQEYMSSAILCFVRTKNMSTASTIGTNVGAGENCIFRIYPRVS